ncbi:MAG: hypothetical protein LiPW41_633 [Parcubacteria group bacterium LiPW_41]|nr:MAG: hypothetical protein LiPW41_633 [Parcubacteria group bacterium LiPW_41]
MGKIIYSICALPLGVFVFVYGGYDDSPGAQLLGFLVVVSGVISAIRSKKKDVR